MYRISRIAVLSLVLSACGGGGGSSSGSTPPPSGGSAGPSLNLSVDRTTIDSGDSVTLNWSSSNVDSCTASGGWTGSRGTSGSENISGISQDTTFSLSCSGANGGVLRDVAVAVRAGGPMVVNFSSDRSIVRQGEGVRLDWSATNAQSCEASGAWSGQQGTSGSFDTGSLGQDSTFTLTCTSGSSNVIEQLSVRIGNTQLAWTPPTSNVDGTVLTDLAGFRIYWGTQPGNYTDNAEVGPFVTQYDLSGLQTDAYWVAMTAFNIDGTESAYSNEVERLVP